jgi:hypothetical protein
MIIQFIEPSFFVGLFLIKSSISCYEFRLYNDFAESLLTRGLSPLPVCILDN